MSSPSSTTGMSWACKARDSKSVVAKDVFVPGAAQRADARPRAAHASCPARPPDPSTTLMYYGRIGAFLIGEGASVAVGAHACALDLYEEVLLTKRSTQRPTLQLHKEPEFLHYYGQALTKVSTAEAALIRAGEEFMLFTRDEKAGIAKFDFEREYRLSMIGIECINMAWDAIERISSHRRNVRIGESRPADRAFLHATSRPSAPIPSSRWTASAMSAAKAKFGWSEASRARDLLTLLPQPLRRRVVLLLVGSVSRAWICGNIRRSRLRHRATTRDRSSSSHRAPPIARQAWRCARQSNTAGLTGRRTGGHKSRMQAVGGDTGAGKLAAPVRA